MRKQSAGLNKPMLAAINYSPDMWVQLGNARYAIGRRGDALLAGAEKAYWRAAATNPDVFVNLGQLAWEVGDKGTALRLAKRALEFNPTNGPALVNTILYAADGDPHRVQERLAEAEFVYQTTLTSLRSSQIRCSSFTDGPRRGHTSGALSTSRAECAPCRTDLSQGDPLRIPAFGAGAVGSKAALELALRGRERLPHCAALQQLLTQIASGQGI